MLHLHVGSTGPQVFFTSTFTLASHPWIFVSILIKIRWPEGLVIGSTIQSPFVILVEADEVEWAADIGCLAPSTNVVLVRARGLDARKSKL